MDLCKTDLACRDCVKEACDFYVSKDPNGANVCVTSGMDPPNNGTFSYYVMWTDGCPPPESDSHSTMTPLAIGLLATGLLVLVAILAVVYFNLGRYKRYRQMRAGAGPDFVSLQ